MSVCLNKSSVEYQTLLKRSGLSEFKFNAFVSNFYGKYNRFPELDEIPGADSSNYLNQTLATKTIDGTSFVDNNQILKQIGTEDVKEANIRINNTYRDLEVELTPLHECSSINIKHRPSRWANTQHIQGQSVIKEPVNNAGVFNTVLEKLANLYGINFIPITNDQLASEEWKDLVDDAKSTNAFVYQNNIYINIDNSNVEAPLHEMLHIILGSLRYSDSDLYFSLVDSMNDIPSKENYAKLYKNRTNSDLNEELLVTEFSRYVMGKNSIFKDLPKEIVQKIQYDMNRVLDSILFGEQSVSSINPKDLFKMSLSDLTTLLGSKMLTNNNIGSLNTSISELHRRLSNLKSDLIKSKELEEYCE